MIIINAGTWRLGPKRRWWKIGRPTSLGERKFPENVR